MFELHELFHTTGESSHYLDVKKCCYVNADKLGGFIQLMMTIGCGYHRDYAAKLYWSDEEKKEECVTVYTLIYVL